MLTILLIYDLSYDSVRERNVVEMLLHPANFEGNLYYKTLEQNPNKGFMNMHNKTTIEKDN